jgi:hypothetical protein
MWRGIDFDKMAERSEESDMFLWLLELDGFMPISVSCEPDGLL